MQLEEILALDRRARPMREPVPTDLRVGMIGLGRFVNNAVHKVDILLSWFDKEPELGFANQTRKTAARSVVAVRLVFRMDPTARSVTNTAPSRRSWPVTAVGEPGSVDGTDHFEIPEPGQPRMARSSLRIDMHAMRGVAVDIPLKCRYAPESFAATMGDLCWPSTTMRNRGVPVKTCCALREPLFAIEASIRSGGPVRLAHIAA